MSLTHGMRPSNLCNYCRCCLSSLAEHSKKNIYGTTVDDEGEEQVPISEWLSECLSVVASRDDGFPDCLCEGCYTTLKEFWRFRQKCKEVEQELSELLSAWVVRAKCNDEDEKVLDELIQTNEEIGQVLTEERNPLDDWELENVKEHSASKEKKSTLTTAINAKIHQPKNHCEDVKEMDIKAGFLIAKEKGLNTMVKEMSKKPSTSSWPFQCSHCSRRCISQRTFEAHQRKHQGLQPYPCNQCDSSFGKITRLTDHIKEVHEQAVRITCLYEGCGKVFNRKSSYQKHVRIHHNSYAPKPREYVCDECGATLNNSTKFGLHKMRHKPEEEYPFHCDKCQKGFIKKCKYEEHLKRHDGNKQCVCPYCGLRKVNETELKIHVNYHTKEKQFPCPLCPMVFNSKTNLSVHDRVVHKKIKRYQCRYCDQKFGKNFTWKNHEMRHTGEKPHECRECGKRFLQKVALNAHLKTHNKLEELKR